MIVTTLATTKPNREQQIANFLVIALVVYILIQIFPWIGAILLGIGLGLVLLFVAFGWVFLFAFGGI